jgi:membrane protein DedA with SNARE-associated domain
MGELVLASVPVIVHPALAYFLVFGMILLCSAGVPWIGTLVMGGDSVPAGQGQLELAPVLVASVLGGETGGIIGYQVGARWG